jgi:hypothetical protein
MGRPAGQLPEAPTYKARYDVTGIIGHVVPVTLGFHTRKNFSENYPQFGYAPPKGFASPVLG